ncbi:hypothetical protein CEXT_61611 [Caerostris extrusa]|uniref:Amine oxidase n=1 Tax=Caerostris extrusa TaxID=172846 RepID=A0AAV4XHX6_CAEEX|nr:hypothetical protein CEXT_61611 [Caerostris extrusa]
METAKTGVHFVQVPDNPEKLDVMVYVQGLWLSPTFQKAFYLGYIMEDGDSCTVPHASHYNFGRRLSAMPYESSNLPSPILELNGRVSGTTNLSSLFLESI